MQKNEKKCEKIWKAQVLHSIFAVAFGNRVAQMTHIIKATVPVANTPLVYVGSPKKNNTHVSVTFGMVARWSRRVQQSVRTDVAWRHKSG